MESHPLVANFGDVDGAEDPAALLRYLDSVSSLESARAYKRFTFGLLKIKAGARVLDAGCGTGEDACALGHLVGSEGQVIGVDNSDTIIAEARRRAAELNLPVEFRSGDVHALDFPQNSFDACRCDRTFQHLESPPQALRELIRVLRPGGRVVVSDTDWGSVLIASEDRVLTRHLLDFCCDSTRNGWMGRQLSALFRQSGLVEVSITPRTITLEEFAIAEQALGLTRIAEHARSAGATTAEESERWLAGLQAASHEGRFFAAVTGFLACGRKP